VEEPYLQGGREMIGLNSKLVRRRKEIDAEIESILSEIRGMSYITQKQKLWGFVDFLLTKDKVVKKRDTRGKENNLR
jgi:hypothetical protein